MSDEACDKGDVVWWEIGCRYWSDEEDGGRGRDGDAVRVGCRREETEARGKSSTTGWKLCTALSPVPGDGVDSKVRSFIEWKHATGVRFRCHVLRGCHARGAVGEVERPSSQGPPTSHHVDATIHPPQRCRRVDQQNIAEAGPRIPRRTCPELRARVVEGGGTGTFPRRPRWLGAVVNHRETRNKSHGRRREPLGGHGKD